MKKHFLNTSLFFSFIVLLGCKNGSTSSDDDMILGKWLSCSHPNISYIVTKETDSTFRFGPVEDKTIIKRKTVGLYSEVNGRFLLRFSDNNHMALEGNNGGLKLLCREVK